MIIDTQQQLQDFLNDIADKPIVLVPLTEDEFAHPAINGIIGYYVKLFGGKEYTILQSHPEAGLMVDVIPLLKDVSKIYCVNKQALTYNGIVPQMPVVDAYLQAYLHNGIVPEQTTFKSAEFYHRRLPLKTNILTDVMKLQQRARQLTEGIEQTTNLCEGFYEQGFQSVFHTIEQNGLKVDVKKFKTTFPEYNLIGEYAYSKYNFYTATGRPSNRFGGVNFAALNKEDETRASIISRYTDGVLVELDFESYHPRILADLIGYSIDAKENIYEHLAKYYFDTPNPTKTQVKESKELTFRQIYGGINNKYKSIEYFNRVENFTNLIWNYYLEHSVVQSKISKRDIRNIEDVNATKLLNYLIQLHETEQNVVFLHALFKKLHQDIKPILYTYDSVLFDLPESLITELENVLTLVIPAEFPYRLKKGKNYKDLA